MTEKIRLKTGEKLWTGFFHLAVLCPVFGIYPCYKLGKLRKFGVLVGICFGTSTVANMLLPWPFGLLIGLPVYLDDNTSHQDKWKKIAGEIVANLDKSQNLSPET